THEALKSEKLQLARARASHSLASPNFPLS
ncbi:hypothetical protein MNBD_BACTEROID06-1245, partial [hydrothermal vent metagenome]